MAWSRVFESIQLVSGGRARKGVKQPEEDATRVSNNNMKCQLK